MKKEQVLNAIVGKLISEGVLAENYNTNEALMVLSHCVMPIKLQTYLVNCEEEVKVRLEKLSQIKQINATENPESLPRIKQQFTADEAEDYINQEVEKRIAEKMPSEEEWIDIKDRMPESGQCVLIYSHSGGVAEGAWLSSKNHFEQWRWSAVLNDVTHWMPLPEFRSRMSIHNNSVEGKE